MRVSGRCCLFQETQGHLSAVKSRISAKMGVGFLCASFFVGDLLVLAMNSSWLHLRNLRVLLRSRVLQDYFSYGALYGTCRCQPEITAL